MSVVDTINSDLEPEELLAQLKQQVKVTKAVVDARKYRANAGNLLKERARMEVSLAIRDGRLIPGTCERCGHANAEAHHDDYRKPLAVRWLCQECHSVFHRGQRTHCNNGHPWVPENIYVTPNGKRQYCRKCRELGYRRKYIKVSAMRQIQQWHRDTRSLLELAATELRRHGSNEIANKITEFLATCTESI